MGAVIRLVVPSIPFRASLSPTRSLFLFSPPSLSLTLSRSLPPLHAPQPSAVAAQSLQRRRVRDCTRIAIHTAKRRENDRLRVSSLARSPHARFRPSSAAAAAAAAPHRHMRTRAAASRRRLKGAATPPDHMAGKGGARQSTLFLRSQLSIGLLPLLVTSWRSPPHRAPPRSPCAAASTARPLPPSLPLPSARTPCARGERERGEKERAQKPPPVFFLRISSPPSSTLSPSLPRPRRPLAAGAHTHAHARIQRTPMW